MMTAEHWIDFFVQIAAVFLGAGLAFLFNWWHYKRQKREENIVTLDFFIASVSSISNNALNLKEQIVQHRYKEAVDCKKVLDLHREEAVDCTKIRQNPPRLQIKYMWKYIYCGDFEWPIAQEKLEFLTRPNPDVIMLVGTAKMAVSKLNTIICDINADIATYARGEQQRDVNIIMMISKNECLFSQLDEALGLIKTLGEVLIEFGLFTYGKRLKMSIELTDEKYKALLPKPIESWEGHEWFPQKKKRWGLKTERTAK